MYGRPELLSDEATALPLLAGPGAMTMSCEDRRRGTNLSLEGLHSLDHGVDGGNCFLGRRSSELSLLGGLVEACGDGLCLLVDVALRGFEVAPDELERHLEKRRVEDELVVGHKLRRVPHSALSAASLRCLSCLNSFAGRLVSRTAALASYWLTPSSRSEHDSHGADLQLLTAPDCVGLASGNGERC